MDLPTPVNLGNKTFFSLHVVTLLLVFTTWLIRLSDSDSELRKDLTDTRVQLDRMYVDSTIRQREALALHNDYDRRILRLEVRQKLQHPHED